MEVELGPGVADLLWRLGEAALTVELTLDFEQDVTKQAVAFPGAAEPSLGYQCHRVGDLEVWWRQRLVLAPGVTRLSREIRPHRLLVGRVGKALSVEAHYA